MKAPFAPFTALFIGLLLLGAFGGMAVVVHN
jgi:hypothetical protein